MEKRTDDGRYPRFPLFISLRGRAVQVIGGGRIAARRVETLLRFGAAVTVVSPELCPALRTLSDRLCWRRECYSGLDAGLVLAVAATDDREVNRRVGEDARRVGIPVSVADRKEESSFWFPAVVAEGNLVAGIVSADGDHHAVKQAAEMIREQMEEQWNAKTGADRDTGEPPCGGAGGAGSDGYTRRGPGDRDGAGDDEDDRR